MKIGTKVAVCMRDKAAAVIKRGVVTGVTTLGARVWDPEKEPGLRSFQEQAEWFPNKNYNIVETGEK